MEDPLLASLMKALCLAPIIGLIPAAIAHHKGTSITAWWIYGALLFIVALPHSIIIRSLDDTTEGGTAYRVSLALMAIWTVICICGLLSGLAAVSEIQPANEFEEAGAALGAAVGLGFWGMLWFFPTLVLGIIALATRPRAEKIQVFPQPILCSHCGKYYTGPAKYCPNCGQEVPKASTPSDAG